MGLSLSHIWSSGGRAKGKFKEKMCEKVEGSLCGDCGGERQRRQNVSNSYPRGDVHSLV